MALETAYHLEITLDFELLKKFATDENFHSRVSALRAFCHLKTSEAKEFLMSYIQDEKNDTFTKVIAIWSLWRMDDKSIQTKLWNLREEISDENTGFGGDIMDPRICTYFPSPRSAIVGLHENKILRKNLVNI